jgi:hypothetical protein
MCISLHYTHLQDACTDVWKDFKTPYAPTQPATLVISPTTGLKQVCVSVDVCVWICMCV